MHPLRLMPWLHRIDGVHVVQSALRPPCSQPMSGLHVMQFAR